MPIEILSDNPNNETLDAAFALIEKKIKEGHRFTNDQKDLGIQLSLDALAPTERPWFFEICNINRIPLWQGLWGQFRRTQEWGYANAPLLDPGWKDDWKAPEYGLEERECEYCHERFKPDHQGMRFCSNRCGVEDWKRQRPKQEAPKTVLSNFIKQIDGTGETNFVESKLESDSVDLGTDEVEVG